MALSRKRLLFTAILFSLLLMVSPAVYADEALKITSSEISVMPEYDTGDILVIYSMNYVNTSTKPYSGEMKLKVPKEALNPINLIIAEDESTDPNHEHIQPAKADMGDHAEFTWKPRIPIQPSATYPLHIEFYYNNFLTRPPEKDLSFYYQPSFATDQLVINVLQPLKATDMKLTPAASSSGTDTEGFTYYQYQYSNPGLNDKFSIKATYTKTDPNPSIQPNAPAQNQAAADSNNTAVGFDLKTFIIVFLIVVAALLLIVKLVGNKSGTASKPANKSSGNKNNAVLSTREQKLLKQYQMGIISEETYLESVAELESEIENNS